MSEPYSAAAQVTIERTRLTGYLDAAPKPARRGPTGRSGGRFSWERHLTRSLERVEQLLARLVSLSDRQRHRAGHPSAVRLSRRAAKPGA